MQLSSGGGGGAVKREGDIHHQLVPPPPSERTDAELQSSDSEDDAQSDLSEMGDFMERSFYVLFVPDTDVECVTVQSK